jgi:hypothetical protein
MLLITVPYQMLLLLLPEWMKSVTEYCLNTHNVCYDCEMYSQLTYLQ